MLMLYKFIYIKKKKCIKNVTAGQTAHNEKNKYLQY